jgi:hypothetical protein
MTAQRAVALRRRHAIEALALTVLVSLLIAWWAPLRTLAWPVLLGSTLAHELGHGLTAALLGGNFMSLDMFGDGSGVATYRGVFGALDIALIAAGGLLGPPFAAMLLLMAGVALRPSHIALGALGGLLALAAVLWAGNFLTVVYCAVLSGILGVVAIYGGARLSQLVCVFIAVQLALASFTRSDYLFTAVARTGSGEMPSDVGQIAEALWLPYWFWGGSIALLSAVFVLVGCWRFLRALG